MKQKKFNSVEIEIVLFDIEDIVCKSPIYGGGDDIGEDNGSSDDGTVDTPTIWG